MIEALLVPVVKKAVDFLFDEGREVLKAHFGRQDGAPKVADKEGSSPQQPDAMGILSMAKDDALRRKIDEAAIEHHKAALEHLLRLQEIQSRNYHSAKEQEARWGKDLVPPVIVNRVVDTEKELAETTSRIQEVLDTIYK
jgi:hypothetical protein